MLVGEHQRGYLAGCKVKLESDLGREKWNLAVDGIYMILFSQPVIFRLPPIQRHLLLDFLFGPCVAQKFLDFCQSLHHPQLQND